MAMTLRLDEELDAALSERARREGRSKQEVAREAIRVYVEHYSKRELLDLVLDTELPRYQEALDRLGQ
jgi:predicted transcriptional regulator